MELGTGRGRLVVGVAEAIVEVATAESPGAESDPHPTSALTNAAETMIAAVVERVLFAMTISPLTMNVIMPAVDWPGRTRVTHRPLHL
ncbi:hypothetical protein IU449_03555 [Nocardia higoensis]|uniref:Uncharacterized protein n=1 Tax=Nocardia higoensis TaxID=228599 RepID=A0ABS0D583_9NOCA|nr:hypothetical protein [Nocardia higoensis]MBF6353634.1 hypothetical protein [Nocardia higoensis]